MQINLLGVTVKVTWQFLALLTFMLSLNAGNVLYALFFSLLHEFGHLLVLCAVSNKPKSVTFELSGINICRNTETRVSLKQEILVSLGGPIINLILFAIFSLLFMQTTKTEMLNIASVNLILGVFNLLPIKSLDGGKILYYFLSSVFSYKVAKFVLTITSVAFIFLMLFYGVYVLYITKYNFTMLIIALLLSLSMFSEEEC